MAEDPDLTALLGADAETVRDVLARVDHAELRAHLTPELERPILDELFARLPEYLDATDVTDAFAWEVGGRRWVVSIDAGTATVAESDAAARVTLALDAVDTLGLVTGTADPATLFFTGRLELAGDEAHVLELATYFRAPTAAGGVDPTRVDVSHMVGVLADVPEKDLRDRLAGGMREPVLSQVFARFPEYLDPERTQDLQVVLKWTLTGRADGEADRWLVHIDRGACRVDQDTSAEPRVSFRMDAADFLKLVTGNLNPTLAFVRGKIKVKGDLGFAATLPRLFRIPRAGEE
jgi:predicted lipid carrier protein YhbT